MLSKIKVNYKKVGDAEIDGSWSPTWSLTLWSELCLQSAIKLTSVVVRSPPTSSTEPISSSCSVELAARAHQSQPPRPSYSISRLVVFNSPQTSAKVAQSPRSLLTLRSEHLSRHRIFNPHCHGGSLSNNGGVSPFYPLGP